VTVGGTGFAWLVVFLFAGLPLAALVRQACGNGAVAGLFAELVKVAKADGPVLLVSLLWTAITGVGVAFLARRACWLAVRSAGFARFLFVLCVLLALTPGPVVGFGLKDAILCLLDAEHAVFGGSFRPLGDVLYYRPSPVPVMWAAAVRLFPVACVLLWPAVRAIPRELIEAAAIDGHGSAGVRRLVVVPLTRGASGAAAVAVAALALCEVSAGKLVATAGGESFILRLFAQMHYGTESTVAALCLLQVGVSVGLAAALGRITSGRA
jgi:iron(III) transport system permease protein